MVCSIGQSPRAKVREILSDPLLWVGLVLSDPDVLVVCTKEAGKWRLGLVYLLVGEREREGICSRRTPFRKMCNRSSSLFYSFGVISRRRT